MNEKSYLPDYLTVPSVILKDKDLQSLDGLVYGVIYWYARMKNEKCTAMNATIAELLDVHPQSISRSISRLAKKGFVTVITDEFNHRLELIPNLSFSPTGVLEDTPKPVGLPPLTPKLTPPKPVGLHNNNNLKRKVNNISTNVDASPVIYGKIEINELTEYFRAAMQIPKEDCTYLQSRRYWNFLLKESKTGVEGVKWLIDLAGKDSYYRNNITSSRDLYYKRIKLISRIRGSVPKIAVMKEGGDLHG